MSDTPKGPMRVPIRGDDGSDVLHVPAGYIPLPDGALCRCMKMWRTSDGAHWCCNATPVSAEAERLKARVQELLEANNRYLEEARSARAELEAERTLSANLQTRAEAAEARLSHFEQAIGGSALAGDGWNHDMAAAPTERSGYFDEPTLIGYVRSKTGKWEHVGPIQYFEKVGWEFVELDVDAFMPPTAWRHFSTPPTTKAVNP